jgi:hypothetical protein
MFCDDCKEVLVKQPAAWITRCTSGIQCFQEYQCPECSNSVLVQQKDVPTTVERHVSIRRITNAQDKENQDQD